jgi:perosamine synthetase
VTKAEEQLREISGREDVVLAGRATLALAAGMRALGLPRRSEVLVPVMVCPNPGQAVRIAGLKPLFVDIDPVSFNTDLRSAEKVVGPETRVLLVCPLFGHPLDCAAVLDFAKRHGLILIEDAAQAVGLRHSDRPAGSLGLCSVYSFGQGKIADAGGGAALLTNDGAFAERVREALATMGGMAGNTFSTERIAAALEGLPVELRGRARATDKYRQALNLPGVMHPDLPGQTPLWKYSILVPGREERDRATRALLAAGIEATNLYRPIASYFHAARNSASRFEVAEQVSNRIIILPLWPPNEGRALRAREALVGRQESSI